MDDRLNALMAALVIGAGLWIASRVYRAWIARVRGSAEVLAGIGLPADGRPVVLGFTGDYCLPCKTQQHPALQQLGQQLGAEIHIRELDALGNTELARRYGVLTVPTTVVLDGRRRVIAINYGVTLAGKLAKQLEPYLGRADSTPVITTS
jgi:thiol-disulfide isomerase/thioredoxin